METESNTSRLNDSTKSLIYVNISDSHDTECLHPQHDTLYDYKSFHVEPESNDKNTNVGYVEMTECVVSNK